MCLCCSLIRCLYPLPLHPASIGKRSEIKPFIRDIKLGPEKWRHFAKPIVHLPLRSFLPLLLRLSFLQNWRQSKLNQQKQRLRHGFKSFMDSINNSRDLSLRLLLLKTGVMEVFFACFWPDLLGETIGLEGCSSETLSSSSSTKSTLSMGINSAVSSSPSCSSSKA